MKKIIFTIIFVIAVNAVFAQTYNMKIKQGAITVYSQTSTVDEITFDNTTNFTCGNPILYGGDLYPTVLIGSQCWFQKHLNIGTKIAGSFDQTDNNIIEKYCYNDIDANCITYGGLYQWAETVQYLNGATNTTSPDPAFTGNVQGICPEGWHIPTLPEFQTLNTEVSNDGNALKAQGQGTGYGAGTNTSGFSALLAGQRDYTGAFRYLFNTYLWSSTGSTAVTNSWRLHLGFIGSSIGLGPNDGRTGFSVRCLKD